MNYFLIFVIGFALSGACFGISILLQGYLFRKNMHKLQGFSMVLVSLIPAVIVCVCFGVHPFHMSSLLDWRMWLVAIATVILTSLIVSLKRGKYAKEPMLLMCLEAACMEIPQRVMMQTFVCSLLAWRGLNTMSGVLINALIWCMAIIFQACCSKNRNYKHLAIELASSFVFSIGIGYVFYASGCIVIPMLAHAAERAVTRMSGRHATT